MACSKYRSQAGESQLARLPACIAFYSKYMRENIDIVVIFVYTPMRAFTLLL